MDKQKQLEVKKNLIYLFKTNEITRDAHEMSIKLASQGINFHQIKSINRTEIKEVFI